MKANKGRYECGGYIYTGEGQDIGQFWAKLNVGNAKVKKTSSNPTVTDGNANYSFEGATFGVYSDKGCNSQLATLTADGNGDTKEVEVKAGTVYIKELSAPKGYKLDSTVHALNVAVTRTPLLTVLVLPSGATEKPESACHEPHRHSMTQPSISHCHRHRLAIWSFSIPLTIPATMLPM